MSTANVGDITVTSSGDVRIYTGDGYLFIGKASLHWSPKMSDEYIKLTPREQVVLNVETLRAILEQHYGTL